MILVELIMYFLTFYGKDIYKATCSCVQNNDPTDVGKDEQENFGL